MRSFKPVIWAAAVVIILASCGDTSTVGEVGQTEHAPATDEVPDATTGVKSVAMLFLEQMDAVVGDKSQILHFYLPVQPMGITVGGNQGVLRLAVEIAHGFVIGNTAVLVGLVKFDQLLPGIVEFFLGRQKGH